MSEQAKHTPGPWEASQCQSSCFPEHGLWRVESGVDIVCNLWWLVESTHVAHEFDEDYSEANARLIAAAPELLAACEGMIRISQLWSPSIEWSNEYKGELAAMLAAIAKATGGKECSAS